MSENRDHITYVNVVTDGGVDGADLPVRDVGAQGAAHLEARHPGPVVVIPQEGPTRAQPSECVKNTVNKHGQKGDEDKLSMGYCEQAMGVEI